MTAAPNLAHLPPAAEEAAVREWLRCRRDVVAFAQAHVHIYNATQRAWLPLRLWPQQRTTLTTLAQERLVALLKARQLGISWLTLVYALWLLLFHAPATVLLFSMREAEAVELLRRLRGMYERLPSWMQAEGVVQQSVTVWALSNGSRVLAFSTRSGRGYTGTLAIVDEADYVPDLGQFLNGVKPTIDAGGQLFLVSTSDKRRPTSTFKQVFRAALAGVGDYAPVFLPWDACPQRDAAWHARTQAEMFAQRGTHDDFFAEYPATPEEALAPSQADRRLPLAWILACLEEQPGLIVPNAPLLPGLTIYAPPSPQGSYVIGVDPAEGNPHSDESVATVLDATPADSPGAWVEVAALAGRLEPGLLADYVAQLARYYGHAGVMVERNNHGHSVIHALLRDGGTRVLNGEDGRPGWLTNVRGKPLLYDWLAQALRDGSCRLRSSATADQLAALEAGTLRAPAGLHDDRAMSFALAVAALVLRRGQENASVVVAAPDVLTDVDQGRAW